MGDRYLSYYPCPQCGKEVEECDASSSLMFIAICDACGWKDPRDYYEIGENEIALCTKEELQELIESNPEIKKFREEITKLDALV